MTFLPNFVKTKYNFALAIEVLVHSYKANKLQDPRTSSHTKRYASLKLTHTTLDEIGKRTIAPNEQSNFEFVHTTEIKKTNSNPTSK